jgi:hypothetical protein
MALIRLLERQGLLQGDINHLQRYALQEIIKQELRDQQKREFMRFRFQAAIAYPEAAARIFNEAEPEFVPDIEEYDPNDPGFSQEGLDSMLATLEQFGFFTEEI